LEICAIDSFEELLDMELRVFDTVCREGCSMLSRDPPSLGFLFNPMLKVLGKKI